MRCYNIDMIAFSGKKGCSSCNQPKDEKCGASPAVLQINNPSECMLFHKVEIPASMGNEITIPPKPGLYKNVLLYYEATGNAYFYSSDGIPTPISYTDYVRLMNKPSINGVQLVGDKSLEEIGVNDATLTIKQDGTTLGTFSANASQDTEIDIPAGGADDSIRLTVAYGAGAWANGDMPGLNIDYSSATGGSFISGRIIPSPTFTDESTGTVYTSEDVYGLLEDGKKVTLDAVPLGWRINDSSEPAVQLVDGVPIVSKVNYGGGATAYFGGTMCPYVLSETVTMFGISILRQVKPDQSVAYLFITQGVENITTPI